MKHHGYRMKKMSLGLSVTPMVLAPSPQAGMPTAADAKDGTNAAFSRRKHRENKDQSKHAREIFIELRKGHIDRARVGDIQSLLTRGQSEARSEIRAKMAKKANDDRKELRAKKLLKQKMELDDSRDCREQEADWKKQTVELMKQEKMKARLKLVNSNTSASQSNGGGSMQSSQSMPTVVNVPYNPDFASGTYEYNPSGHLATSSAALNGLSSHLIHAAPDVGRDLTSASAAYGYNGAGVPANHHSLSQFSDASGLSMPDRVALTQHFIADAPDAMDLLTLRVARQMDPPKGTQPGSVSDQTSAAMSMAMMAEDDSLLQSQSLSQSLSQSQVEQLGSGSVELPDKVERTGWKIAATQEGDFDLNRQDTFVFGGGFNVG